MPSDHEPTISAVEGQSRTECPHIDSLDEEGGRGDFCRSDHSTITQAGLSSTSNLRIEHIKAYPCGLEDIEEVDLLEGDIEVLIRLVAQCTVDADTSLSTGEVKPSDVHLALL
jgi:hypothetical protein